MGVKFNPFTGNLDLIDTTAAAGADTQVQFNNGGNLAGSADLTWDDTGKELGIGGDINLDDGGTYATTLQLITPTANRTISFPDATGTVGLVGGASGQLIYNNAGAYAGAPSTSVGATGNITLSLAGAASTPPVSLTGTWFSGGTSTTTKPQLLIEPNGTTSTAWNTSGTGLGVNAASGFTGRLIDLQLNGTSVFHQTAGGLLKFGCGSFEPYSNGFIVTTNAAASAYSGYWGSDKLQVAPAVNIAWGSANGYDGSSLVLARDAAGILAQRNGTNAQTYRLYNTLTGNDVSATGNYERAFLQWNSSVFEIGTEAGSGGGSEQPVRITAATLKLPNLPTYADNAAATTGGLVAGDVYKTATGELRITV